MIGSLGETSLQSVVEGNLFPATVDFVGHVCCRKCHRQCLQQCMHLLLHIPLINDQWTMLNIDGYIRSGPLWENFGGISLIAWLLLLCPVGCSYNRGLPATTFSLKMEQTFLSIAYDLMEWNKMLKHGSWKQSRWILVQLNLKLKMRFLRKLIERYFLTPFDPAVSLRTCKYLSFIWHYLG